MTYTLLSIPSPSFNSFGIGPLTFTLYGLMIGLGISAATLLAGPRSLARRLHPDTPLEMLTWVVPAGIVGARVYHIVTDGVPIRNWHRVTEGGLGIPGAIAFGVIGGLLFVRRRGLDRNKVMDAVVPGIPLAQAIGRLGNWWNQELYGRPTDLPWALEIDLEHRVAGFTEFETFHPTFLYESLWNIGLVLFLIWIDRKRILMPGKLIWVYVGGYAIGRLWIEAIRIDNATSPGGIRINLIVMAVLLLVSIIALRTSFDRDGAAARLAGSGAVGAAGAAGAAKGDRKAKADGGSDEYAEDTTDDTSVDEEE